MRIFFVLTMLFFSSLRILESCESEIHVSVFSDPQEVGKAAAQKIVDLIIKKQNEGQASIILGFATGNSPIPTYSALKKLVREYDLDLSNIITFNLDEYIGLPRSHDQSYYSFMFANLFEELIFSSENLHGIKRENIHIPKGAVKNEADLSMQEITALYEQFPLRQKGSSLTHEEQFWVAGERAKEYENLIQSLGPIDLQILGIGRNGHIGFAEPGTSFDSETMVAKLTDHTRAVNSAFFDGKIEDVPEFAITMGIKTILQAKEILLIATGQSKAEIINEALQNPISPSIPCTALRMHPNTSFYLDQEAASLLKSAVH